uniref:hypothetical protein n=1 Tax=Salinicola sp. CPA57 TaxID=1949080 RepID=UPI00130098FE
AIELSWEEHTATYVRGDTGPQGEIVNRKRVRIKARIPNLSKMEFGLRFSSESGLETSTLFEDKFVKDGKGGSLELQRKAESSSIDYELSHGKDSVTIERKVFISDQVAVEGVELYVEYFDKRARSLSYQDTFSMRFS